MDFIIKHGLIPGWPGQYPGVHSRLDALDTAGLIYWPAEGQGMPQLKRYLDSTKGTAIDDVFADISRLEAKNERLGIPRKSLLPLAHYQSQYE